MDPPPSPPTFSPAYLCILPNYGFNSTHLRVASVCSSAPPLLLLLSSSSPSTSPPSHLALRTRVGNQKYSRQGSGQRYFSLAFFCSQPPSLLLFSFPKCSPDAREKKRILGAGFCSKVSFFFPSPFITLCLLPSSSSPPKNALRTRGKKKGYSHPRPALRPLPASGGGVFF